MSPATASVRVAAAVFAQPPAFLQSQYALSHLVQSQPQDETPPLLAESTQLPDSPGMVRAAGLRRHADYSDSENRAIAPSDFDRLSQTDEAKAARASDRPARTTRSSETPCPSDGAIVAPTPPPAPPPPSARNSAASAVPKLPAGTASTTTVAPVADPSISPPPQPCRPVNPYTRFLNSTAAIPLTPRQKAYLALHNFIDPGNLITVIGTSAVAIASDPHTAYGPGMKGFGENAGLSFVQDATGDFFGTFLVPAIAREDPHYHRRPEATIPRRIVHAISRTIIAQGDDGHPMPNYATLLTYPITAEIANLYVPGVANNGPGTIERIVTGYATDPIDNLITEFLPDIAKRVHVRVIFVQQIINQVAAGQPVSVF